MQEEEKHPLPTAETLEAEKPMPSLVVQQSGTDIVVSSPDETAPSTTVDAPKSPGTDSASAVTFDHPNKNTLALARSALKSERILFLLGLGLIPLLTLTVVLLFWSCLLTPGTPGVWIRASIFLCFLVSMLYGAFVTNLAVKRMVKAISVISSVKPTTMQITRIKQIQGEPWILYSIKLADAVGDPPVKKLLKAHQRRYVPDTEQKTWYFLCAASSLADSGQSKVFPITCDAYIDPDNQEPVAFLIKDALAFIEPCPHYYEFYSRLGRGG
jgi:hypothetical protein